MKERLKAAAKSAASRATGPAPKQVKLKLVQIGFWSAVKAGLLVTIATGIAMIVGFFLIWLVVSSTGLFGSLSTLINGIIGGGSGTTEAGVNVAEQLSLPRVMSFAITTALFNIVIGTLLTGISAAIYNVIARLTGGISVGFTNDQ
ncbi:MULTISPECIES: DUF3566 domain-containing protein [Rhodoluna]|mgnify:CR=1 FL=1|jgi:hypothetical protein|uniref:DUF3566 domain-containing protein n=1 Tax=Rhodoluna TaxID=529883 RepID=UPI0011067AF2|nr:MULTISPECIES: DUF3566 domain-containing protein [Rhodoluna]BDS48430.1 hypothetical protein RKAS3_00070 [Rhodoluna sp. KAS3]